MSLQLSGSSCLRTSSPTVLSVSADGHVNGNNEGKPCARAKQNREGAALYVRFYRSCQSETAAFCELVE